MLKRSLHAVLVAIVGCACQAAAQPAGAPAANPDTFKPIVISDAQLTSFLAAMGEFAKLGDEARVFSQGKSGDATAMVKGMQLSGAAQDILKSHGFSDTTNFQQVAYTTFMALDVVERGGSAAVRQEMDAAKAKQSAAFAQMRAQLPPEQAKLLEQQMGASMAMAEGMQNVPEETLTLVTARRAEIEAVRASFKKKQK